MSSQLARLNQLFGEGKELNLGEDLVYWINKPNPFELEEARRDGMASRSRTILAMREMGTDEYVLFEATLSNATVDDILDRLLLLKEMDFFTEAVRDLQSDEDWQEKIEVLRRGALTPPDNADDIAYLKRLDGEYSEEIMRRGREARDTYDSEARRKPLDELKEDYREAFLDEAGLASYQKENEITRIWYAFRMCRGVQAPDGQWDHGECDHTVRALGDRSEVAKMPAQVISQIQAVLNEITMLRDDARFSDAPRSSSAPLEQPSKQEASSPSIPDVTSPVQAGISS